MHYIPLIELDLIPRIISQSQKKFYVNLPFHSRWLKLEYTPAESPISFFKKRRTAAERGGGGAKSRETPLGSRKLFVHFYFTGSFLDPFSAHSCVYGAESEVTEPPGSRVLWISDAGPGREKCLCRSRSYQPQGCPRGSATGGCGETGASLRSGLCCAETRAAEVGSPGPGGGGGMGGESARRRFI